MNQLNSMVNIYEKELVHIHDYINSFSKVVVLLSIYIIFIFLKNMFLVLNISIIWNWTIILIELGIMCILSEYTSELCDEDFFKRLSINILHIFRYIKPYNRTTFNHLYLNNHLDIDFIINTIIPLSIYKNNERIMNHIMVDQMLNMRRDFDESI